MGSPVDGILVLLNSMRAVALVVDTFVVREEFCHAPVPV